MPNEKPVRTAFEELHQHVEGGDRGGYVREEHAFLVYSDGRVAHTHSLEDADCGSDVLESFDVEPQKLETREEALSFVTDQLVKARLRVQQLEKLREQLETASDYLDTADYWWEEDEEDED